MQTYMLRCMAKKIKSTLVKFEPAASLLMMSPTPSIEGHKVTHLARLKLITILPWLDKP